MGSAAGDRRLPILYVHHRSELGGAPSSLSYLIRTLDGTRFEPHVFCPAGAAAELFARAGARVHTGSVAAFTHIWASTYRGRRWLLLGRELARLPPHLTQLRRSLAAHPFALVHLNDSPLVPAAAVARKLDVPVVWHLRSSLPHGGVDVRSRLIRSAIGRLATCTIAINDNVAASFGGGATVIPNSVDLDRFHPGASAEAKAQLGVAADVPLVSFFGFLYPSKGFRDFIDAARLLRARGVEATYVIVGGGVRGDEFFETTVGSILQRVDLVRDHARDARQLVSRHGLDDVVRLVPYTAETPTYYRASDVVVAPSRGPELGRPVLEAAASGRPVVASGSIDGGGIVLPDLTGVIVPRRSPDTLAAALQKLLTDPPLRERLGAAARRHAEASFNPAVNARRVLELYDSVLSSRG